jgi:hypothetical protein
MLPRPTRGAEACERPGPGGLGTWGVGTGRGTGGPGTGRRGADHPETAPTDDIVPRPARLVRPTDALLRARIPASPVAVPTGEADLLASLADFASSGRT